MGWFGVGQGISGLGNDISTARDALRDDKTKALENQLRMQQYQLQLRQLQQALGMSPLKPEGTISTPGGGTSGITFDPRKGTFGTQTVIPGRSAAEVKKQIDDGMAGLPDAVKSRVAPIAHSLAATGQPEKALEFIASVVKEKQDKPTPFSDWRQQHEVEIENGKLGVEDWLDEQAKILAKYRRLGSKDGIPEKLIHALAVKYRDEGIKPPSKFLAYVIDYMNDRGWKVKVKLNSQEQRVMDVTKQIEPKVHQLMKLIEDNGLMEEGGAWSAIKQGFKMSEYKSHIKPDQLHSDLIKAAAALQVMGAAPWMQIGRGRYIFETIIQHLPSPWDPPALMYDKAQFLQGIVDEARASMPNAGESDQTPPPPEGFVEEQ